GALPSLGSWAWQSPCRRQPWWRRRAGVWLGMVEGFPWDRLQAAQKLLYTIKPWWARFGGRMKIVPIDIPAPPGEKYGGITSTDHTSELQSRFDLVCRLLLEKKK